MVTVGDWRVSNVTVVPECGPPLVRTPGRIAVPRHAENVPERPVELRVEGKRVRARGVAEVSRHDRTRDLVIADDLDVGLLTGDRTVGDFEQRDSHAPTAGTPPVQCRYAS